MQVKTYQKSNVCYTAYHPSQLPQGCVIVYDAYVENRKGEIEYVTSYLGGSMNSAWETENYRELLSTVYLQVPEELGDELNQILREEKLLDASADEIADYVCELGTYDLNTPKVPRGEDFVLYFLTQSRQGYCVHFASSAVLLLRAAGIPARYVSGYSVEGLAGQWNIVSEDEAHAWVEYYTDGAGWLPLDPTPSDWREAMEHVPDEEEPEPKDEEPDKPDEPKKPETPEEKPQAPDKQEDNAAASTGVQHGDQTSSRKLTWHWLLALPLLILIAILRRIFCVLLRKLHCRKAEPNQRALRLWVWLVRLYKAEHKPVPEEMICLAEKAKFSQHEISPEEIARLEAAVAAQIATLKKLPVLHRLWHEYGLALY